MISTNSEDLQVNLKPIDPWCWECKHSNGWSGVDWCSTEINSSIISLFLSSHSPGAVLVRRWVSRPPGPSPPSSAWRPRSCWRWRRPRPAGRGRWWRTWCWPPGGSGRSGSPQTSTSSPRSEGGNITNIKHYKHCKHYKHYTIIKHYKTYKHYNIKNITNIKYNPPSCNVIISRMSHRDTGNKHDTITTIQQYKIVQKCHWKWTGQWTGWGRLNSKWFPSVFVCSVSDDGNYPHKIKLRWNIFPGMFD